MLKFYVHPSSNKLERLRLSLLHGSTREPCQVKVQVSWAIGIGPAPCGVIVIVKVNPVVSALVNVGCCKAICFEVSCQAGNSDGASKPGAPSGFMRTCPYLATSVPSDFVSVA
jgi:hypothetical protein